MASLYHMDKIRIQFIGIDNTPNQEDDEIFRVRKVKWDTNGYQSEENLSFHDYHIVFVNYPLKYPYPPEPAGFLNYISGGGIVVLFLGRSKSYPWYENFLGISLGEGDSIIPDQKHWLKTIFRKYPFTWNCLISKGGYLPFSGIDIYAFECSGTAISGRCVSSVLHYEQGKLILLPILQEIPDDLIRELLDGIKKHYFKTQEIKEPKPPWIESWDLQPELNLKIERDIITKELEKVKEKLEQNTEKIAYYESFKKILYTYGRELSYSVYLIFNELGFETNFKEDEGRQDIEIKSKSLFAIIETKGLKGYANNDDLRQLLDYYVTITEANPEVKAIFIVNHFRNKPPSERGEPYSKGALDLAMKNEFCLLTTVDLFKMYNMLLNGKITINQITDLFKTTKGLCDIEKLM